MQQDDLEDKFTVKIRHVSMHSSGPLPHNRIILLRGRNPIKVKGKGRHAHPERKAQ